MQLGENNFKQSRENALAQFLTLTPLSRISKHIRILLLHYLTTNNALELQEHIAMIEDLTNLFELLDKLEALQEVNGSEQ
jgi:hypothetical protein